jgi:hypothetical protein
LEDFPVNKPTVGYSRHLLEISLLTPQSETSCSHTRKTTFNKPKARLLPSLGRFFPVYKPTVGYFLHSEDLPLFKPKGLRFTLGTSPKDFSFQDGSVIVGKNEAQESSFLMINQMKKKDSHKHSINLLWLDFSLFALF